MIENDAAILEHFVEEWEKVLIEWVDKHKDNLTARNIMNQRNVGEDVIIDVTQKYDRTGPGAQIVAKGTAPDSMGITASTVTHEVYQIATGFWINVKDLKIDPKTKSRLVEIAMKDIHRKEDEFVLTGSTKHNVSGIVDAAQANSLGKIMATGASSPDKNNKGKWEGETGTDIYNDINTAIGMMDGNFEPAYLVGNRKDLLYLNRVDSERIPYYKAISGLFGMKNESDKSWMWMTDVVDLSHKVYLIAKDTLAADFVISTNPHIIPYPMSAGQNYWTELSSWSVPEIYENDAFVEIQIT